MNRTTTQEKATLLLVEYIIAFLVRILHADCTQFAVLRLEPATASAFHRFGRL